jgi:hypothetical protein
MAHNEDKGPVIVTLTCEAREGTGTVEISRAEWDAMTPAQRRARVEDEADQHVNDQGGYGWCIDDSDDDASVGEPGNPEPDPLRELAEWLVSLEELLPEVTTTAAETRLAEATIRAREALGRTGER